MSRKHTNTNNLLVFQGLLGMYFFLDEVESPAVENIRWLPILSLVLFILTYCWGLGPLPWAVMGELFPIEVKAVASPIATAFCWILSFLVTRYGFQLLFLNITLKSVCWSCIANNIMVEALC